METSRAECPDCPCSYCHGNHPKINCPNPRVKPCEMCGTKAHETKYCLIKPATPDSIKAQFERLAKMKSERLAKARLRAKAGLGPSRKDDRPWPIARLGPSRMNARPRANAGLRPSRMNARDQGDEHFRSFVANGRTYNVSVVGPRHDHPMWSAIPKIVREVR